LFNNLKILKAPARWLLCFTKEKNAVCL